MVTMHKWGNFGRIGNSLFQWAFLSSLARKHNTELVLPKWSHSKYFVNPPKEGTIETEIQVNEMVYTYHPELYEGLPFDKNINFHGYFQSEKYWDEQVLKDIQFTPELKKKVRSEHEKLFNKPTIAIGVRRGDYITGPQVYHNLSPVYYISALHEHFPVWWQAFNLVFISDDLPYCKFHFGCLENAYFPEVTEDIEHMVLMSMCDAAIIGNSTFYWWACKIGGINKVIQPTKLFSGKLLAQHGDVNFYSDDWVKHEEKKIDLKDVTFTIPVMYDHPDRKENLSLVVCLLQMWFETNFIIGEQGGRQFQYTEQFARYMNFDYPTFHRTKMLNEMAKASQTNIIANWDADVIVSPAQLYETVQKIRNGVDMAYPYGWNFVRVDRAYMKEVRTLYDPGVLSKYEFKTSDSLGRPSVGGAVLWKKSSFMQIGMENEYMVSFAPEDVERHERAQALGLKVERVKGDLIHFNHFCGPDSTVQNPHFRKNRELLETQRKMSKDELLNYINSWPWHSPYSAPYYETITEDAIRSRDEIFKILGVGIKGVTKTKDGPAYSRYDPIILDFGAGLGQWGVGKKNYIGIDYRAPKESLLIDPENYVDWDLRTPLNGLPLPKAEIALCLETAEHIEENYADILVDNIVSSCTKEATIIFSAAVPSQGGNNHCNEQFQSYWGEKFAKRGFWPVNSYLPEIRGNKNIKSWYRQNVVIYRRATSGELVEDYVLPEYYLEIVKGLKAK